MEHLSSEGRQWHVAFPFFSRKTWSSALVGKTINNNKFTAEYTHTHTHINMCIKTIQWSLGNIVWHENEIWGRVGSHILHSSSCFLLTEYTHFPSETIHMITCIHTPGGHEVYCLTTILARTKAWFVCSYMKIWRIYTRGGEHHLCLLDPAHKKFPRFQKSYLETKSLFLP